MKIVDSHCHLNMIDLEPFHGSTDQLIEAAKALDVQHMLCVSVEPNKFDEVYAFAEKYDCVSASVGEHPAEAGGEHATFEWLLEKAKLPKVVAIGETGLDYYWCKGNRTWQQDRFRLHIQVAKQSKLPLIIHTRDAREDTVRILQEEQTDPGVFHCFTESYEMAKQGLDLGFYISFSGILTFKNATALQAVAKKIPLDRILVETDAPFLTPAPFRGKPNQSGYTRYVAEYLAELKGVSLEKVAEVTTRNFEMLFKVTV